MDSAIEAVCLLAPPFRTERGWITVPPAGYGGIQWSMAHLMDGLLELGVHVTLLGSPDSIWPDPRVEVVDVAEEHDVRAWLKTNRPRLIHDFANFSAFWREVPEGAAYCRTWALTSAPEGSGNTVYVSEAQRQSMPAPDSRAPVIPLPINVNRYATSAGKDETLLFLGRVSPWKGAYEAAALAAHLGTHVLIAGPTWEPEYRDLIRRDFPGSTTFLGEVGGVLRQELLAKARALLALSQPVPGPWGQIWCEPGASVVAEAAASGTPVISTANGCLPSLMPDVGVSVSAGPIFTQSDTDAIGALPTADQVRRTAVTRWGHVTIARRYLDVYREILMGRRWT